jgi:uronate dehydrogenase
MPQRLLITGAAGQIGGFLRPRLARPGRRLRLLDTAPQTPPTPGEDIEIIRADITDPDAMTTACHGIDAVIHLAAITYEAPWSDLLECNPGGRWAWLQTATGLPMAPSIADLLTGNQKP